MKVPGLEAATPHPARYIYNKSIKYYIILVLSSITTLISSNGLAQAVKEQPLLTRATLITPVRGSDYYSDYCVWLSDHAVISVDYPTSDWHKSPAIVFHDLAHGNVKKVTFAHWPIGTHTRVVCSPDGRWALCLDTEKPQPDAKVVAMDLQTRRVLTWPNLGDPYHLPIYWLSDKRRWLQFPTLEEGYFNVYSVDAPRKIERLSFQDWERANWRTHDFFLTNRDHLLVYNRDESNNTPLMKLDICEYRLFPVVTLLRRFQFVPPVGQNIQSVCFSPSADRIAWIACEPGRKSLWVSHVDGKEPVEIGSIPNQPDDWGPLPNLAWLPGGKRLSFLYQERLYTVPTDDPK